MSSEERIDKRFILIHEEEDAKLYPFKKYQEKSKRFGFALSKPGEGDRHGKGTYTDDIAEVIRKVVLEGWNVRARSEGVVKSLGRVREGSFGIKKRSIIDYEIAEEFEHLVKSAKYPPRAVFSTGVKIPANPSETEKNSSPKENPVDETTMREIKTRRGQADFRNALLLVFGSKCCVSGCEVESVLEAAHIVPHTEETNYTVENGLLLRADIHTLYDLNRIGVDGNGKVVVSDSLKESEYWQYNGKYIAEEIAENMSTNLSRRYSLYEATR